MNVETGRNNHLDPKDQLSRHLQERLKAKEAECILLAASLRKAEEALRPFAEAYRQETDSALHLIDIEHFARAAELVSDSSQP
jgi:hypothetical protein